MKKIFLLALVLSPALSKAQFEKAELQAAGLTCSMCSNAINKALHTLPFVADVQTDLNKSLFTVTFKKDMQPDFDLIKKKVEDAGFSVVGFWVLTDMHNLQVDKDTHATMGGMNFHFMHVNPQLLNGVYRLQVVDRNYVTAKAYKQFGAYTSMACYKTGTMLSCCPLKDGTMAGAGRIYHVTL